jgi:hypothetical protein
MKITFGSPISKNHGSLGSLCQAMHSSLTRSIKHQRLLKPHSSVSALFDPGLTVAYR